MTSNSKKRKCFTQWHKLYKNLLKHRKSIQYVSSDNDGFTVTELVSTPHMQLADFLEKYKLTVNNIWRYFKGKVPKDYLTVSTNLVQEIPMESPDDIIYYQSITCN